ncbi:MAG: hypothetical protein SGBAC_013107 [Bacillariaceae sp.]
MAKRDRSNSAQSIRKRARTSSSDESIQVKEEPRIKKSASKTRTIGRTIFLRKRIELLISLLPGSLRNSEKSVEDAIRAMLMKYSEGLGGILMGFENVKLIGDRNKEAKGWILNELPHIHYNASCDALVFCPTIGCELQGIVNECRPSHMSLLVFNYFNAMISGDQLRAAGFSFDEELNNWTSSKETILPKDKVKFSVEKIHELEGTVSMEGKDPALSLLVEA